MDGFPDGLHSAGCLAGPELGWGISAGLYQLDYNGQISLFYGEGRPEYPSGSAKETALFPSHS